MDADVASSAVAEAGLSDVMGGGGELDAVGLAAERARAAVAFQAESEDGGALEEPCKGGTMGDMACAATVDAGGGVLEGERTAEVDVAFQARLFVAKSGLDQAGADAHGVVGRAGAMGIVTVGAAHESFVHAVLEREGELSTHIGVALVAEVGLAPGEE